MRIKLFFCLNKAGAKLNELPSRIIFPIKLNDSDTILDLKNSINQYIWGKINSKYSVDELFIDNFLLPEEFSLYEILHNDDQVKVYIKESDKYKKRTIKLFDLEINNKKYSSDSSFEVVKSSKKISSEIKKEKDKMLNKNKINKKYSSEEISNKHNKTDTKVKWFRPSDHISNLTHKIDGKKKCLESSDDISKKPTNTDGKRNLFESYEDTSKLSIKNDGKRKWLESSEDEQVFVKNIKNNNLKKVERIELSSFINHAKTTSVDVLENKFDLIPSEVLENVELLKLHYPIIFKSNTIITFRVYELSLQSGGASASKYRKGVINEFYEESKTILINISNDNSEDINNLIDNYGITDELNIISVHLKDFIELWVEKSISTQAVQILDIPKKTDVDDQSMINHEKNKISEQEKIEPKVVAEKKFNKSNNIFNRTILPHIKKQVEYYFSDKNYYKDEFLKEKAQLDENNYIDLKIIMGFNKIKSLSNNILDIITALKDSNVIEFNEDQTKIRKKNILNEFM